MMDSLFIKTGLYGPIPINSGLDVRPCPSQFSAAGRSPALVNAISVDKGSDTPASSSSSSSSSRWSFNHPLRSLLSGGGKKQSPKGVALDDAVLVERQLGEEEGSVGDLDESEGGNENWVLKILHVRSLWSSENKQDVEERESEGQDGSYPSSPSASASSGDNLDYDGDDENQDQRCCEGCSVCDNDDDDDDDEKEKINFDRDSFSKLLKKVPLAEAKLYAQMSYLGNLAYCIPSIKPRNLLKRHGLWFVTSSIEKRELLALAEKKDQKSTETESEDNENKMDEPKSDEQKNDQSRISASAAFHIAASAASYLHSHTSILLPFRSLKKELNEDGVLNVDTDNGNLDYNSEMASLMATTDSVTAVVAAKEEVKQAVADDLSSISSSPCEWYTCDDDKTATRFFVIQGSETLASWQANLLFEPVKFEGLGVYVHRGIYEAAKGMYQQMLPEIHAHIKARGRHAKFRFTGHSLGGSLSLLINLMLLIRGEVPYSSLLPAITFGSPCIMCGGDDLLRKLGLPKSHVQAIVMHRDIVPRAFSCNYPRPAAQLLKAVNRNFRNHPCLNNEKLLYAPMGEMLILQPDEKYSPQHSLLPSGSGLYLLTCKVHDAKEAEKHLRAAMKAFLNMPHPLEILSDRSAYGNGGTIQRDHDMNSYLKGVRAVIRQELSHIRRAERERRRKVWWPLVTPRVTENHVILGPTLGTANVGYSQFKFSGVMRTGRESVKRFSRLVASQHMHLLIVLLFPARLLLIGAFTL